MKKKQMQHKVSAEDQALFEDFLAKIYYNFIGLGHRKKTVRDRHYQWFLDETDETMLPLLVDLLETMSVSPIHQAEMLSVIGQVGGIIAIPVLISYLRDNSEKKWGLWSMAIKELSEFPTEEIETPLKIALASTNPSIRLGAGLLLWRKARHESSFHAVLEGLDSPSDFTKYTALTVIISQPDLRFLGPLKALLTMENTPLNQNVVMALSRLNHSEAEALVSQWTEANVQ